MLEILPFYYLAMSPLSLSAYQGVCLIHSLSVVVQSSTREDHSGTVYSQLEVFIPPPCNNTQVFGTQV